MAANQPWLTRRGGFFFTLFRGLKRHGYIHLVADATGMAAVDAPGALAHAVPDLAFAGFFVFLGAVAISE